MSIGKKLRFEIFKRDGFTCQYCGRKPPAVVLNADHVVAVANGGGDNPENLVTSCFDCNSGKSDRPVDQGELPMVNDSAAMRMEKLEQMKALNEAMMAERDEKEEWVFDLLEEWARKEGQDAEADEFNAPRSLEPALRKFVKFLLKAEIMEAIDIAFGRVPPPRGDYPRFKFFCGVCWRKVKANEKGGK